MRRPNVEAAMRGNGADVVMHLAPREDNLFLFEPRYPAFDQTPLALVLAELSVDRVFDRGSRDRRCVLQTGTAARENGLEVTLRRSMCNRRYRARAGRVRIRATGRRHSSRLAAESRLDFGDRSQPRLRFDKRGVGMSDRVALDAGRGSCALIRGDEILIAVLSRPRAALSVPTVRERPRRERARYLAVRAALNAVQPSGVSSSAVCSSLRDL
jgi:hypothetical protein